MAKFIRIFRNPTDTAQYAVIDNPDHSRVLVTRWSASDEAVLQLGSMWYSDRSTRLAYRNHAIEMARSLAAVDDEGGLSGEQSLFNKRCAGFGLEPADYGRTFKINDRVFTLIGFAAGKTRYPVLIRRDDGLISNHARTILEKIKEAKR